MMSNNGTTGADAVVSSTHHQPNNENGGGGAKAATATASSGVVVDDDAIHMVTVSAPTNIAVVKYWGKADAHYNTPLNDSLSVTLSGLRATTTVAASKTFLDNELWLNGSKVPDLDSNKRFRACLEGVRALAQDVVDSETGNVVVSKKEWQDMKVRVSSYNNFPTAAGLASSAAGYAALVFGLAKLMNASETFPYQLSTIARQGSGSACRSLYGGLVAWRKGSADNAWLDSKAEPIADERSWPEMRAMIVVVSDMQKDIGSTTGMKTSVDTSELLSFRAEHVVPKRMEQVQEAWLARNFNQFAKLTMQDSNQFHATCLDTYPPIFYLNDVSRSIIRLMTVYNQYGVEKDGNLRVGYTFDAGPNAVLYVLQQYVGELGALLKRYYHPPCADEKNTEAWIQSMDSSLESIDNTESYKLDEALLEASNKTGRTPTNGDVQRVYLTKAGPGALVLNPDQSNIDPVTGINTYSPPPK